jgi:hypothetical protein
MGRLITLLYIYVCVCYFGVDLESSSPRTRTHVLLVLGGLLLWLYKGEEEDWPLRLRILFRDSIPASPPMPRGRPFQCLAT